MSPPKQPKAGPSTARLKVVVRRLPADLPEGVFNRSIEPWAPRSVSEGKDPVLSWSSYEPGRLRNSGRDDKHDIHSRAYLTFINEDNLLAFHRAYNGWAFRDKQGNISHAVVEFAPYQRIPSEIVKVDPRQNSIEQDPDYELFLASLSQPAPEEAPSEEMSAADKKRPQSTPLLDHLREQKALRTRSTARGASKKDKGKAVEGVLLYSSSAPGTPGATGTPNGGGPAGRPLTRKEAKALARAAKGKAPKPPKTKKPKEPKPTKAQRAALAAAQRQATPPVASAANFPSLPGAGPLPAQIAGQYEALARQQAVLTAQQNAIQRQLRAQELQQRAQIQQRLALQQQQPQIQQQQPKIALLQNPHRASAQSPAPPPSSQPNTQQRTPRQPPTVANPQVAGSPATEASPNGSATPTGPAKKSRRGGGGAKKAAAAAAAAAGGVENGAQQPRSANGSRSATPAPAGEGEPSAVNGGTPSRGRGRGRGGGGGGRGGGGGGGRSGRGRGGSSHNPSEGQRAPPPPQAAAAS